METAWIVLLGIIQGATEFLPVSSSGHLALGQLILTHVGAELTLLPKPLLLEVLLHLATLCAVLVVYRRSVLSATRGIGRGARALATGKLGAAMREDSDVNLGVAVVVGVIPTAVIGLLMRETAELISRSTLGIGCCFLGCACLIFATRFWPGGERRLTWKIAALVSIVQGIAVLPGISRSGVTIATGLALGLNREEATRFSFLLSVPTIVAAAAIEMDFGMVMENNHSSAYMLSALTAFLVGLAALIWLIRLVRRGQLWFFSPYLALLGICILFFV